MKYQVKVDGRVFDVEVEKIGGGAKPLTMADLTAPSAPAAPVQQAAPAPTPKAEPAPTPKAEPAPASTGGEKVISPMPGNIWKVVAKEGSKVSAGDVILILEAMKMENEIVAPCDGTVSIKVSEGQAVDTDALLAEVK